MPTKLTLTNYGRRGQQVDIVLMDQQGVPRLDAVVSSVIVAPQQIHEVSLLHDQALLVRPLPRSAPPPAIAPARPRGRATGD